MSGECPTGVLLLVCVCVCVCAPPTHPGVCVLSFQVITKANNTLNGISSSAVCTEVIQSAQGMEYLLGEIHTHTHIKHHCDPQLDM